MTGPFRGDPDARVAEVYGPYVGRPAHRPPCPFAIRRSLADRCRGRRPRRPAEGSRPLPTMQTVKGDTMARLRAGHARPLRTAVNGLRTRGAREGGSPPLCSGRVVTQGPSESPSPLTRPAPFDKGASLSPLRGFGGTPEFKVEEGAAALRTDSNTASV